MQSKSAILMLLSEHQKQKRCLKKWERCLEVDHEMLKPLTENSVLSEAETAMGEMFKMLELL